ncbi:MAG: hypothetical protein NHB15_05590 [Methanosarcina barkeri]|nr:hypothetical protein [Methanosarcina sp. ERenArc_MAG2]
MIDQEELHNQCISDDPKKRIEVLGQFRYKFSLLPDKQQAWNDIQRLTNDEKWDVKSAAASALGSAFAHILDKQQAWNDLHRLTNDKKRVFLIFSGSSLILKKQ